jgi:hypothetical protein
LRCISGCLAFSISSDLWLHWLVHEDLHLHPQVCVRSLAWASQPAHSGGGAAHGEGLLRYRPTAVGHDVWLALVTKLFNAAGVAPERSRSLVPPPSNNDRVGHIVNVAPPPPPPPPVGKRWAYRWCAQA